MVRVMRGGICGSDLHYYLHGGFGSIRVREPIIMGHEFAGYIEAVGPTATHLSVGDRVGVSPSQPCGACQYCLEGIPQQCLDMHFIGSAFFVPHEQGGFRERMTVKAAQCFKGGDRTDYSELACAEPLAVCLHAARQVGKLSGKRVLVNGAGPIGALCVAVARYLEAEEIVVIDLFEKTLEVAMQMGADSSVNLNLAASRFELTRFKENKGHFDLVFECSAAQAAIENVFKLVRPQGTIIQVGLTGELNIPLDLLVSKELRWSGSQRFGEEYEEAISLISQGSIDIKPIVTDVFAMDAVHEALDRATDRSRAVKVHLSF
jgi:L-idonate 5-dehydrogenase